MKCLILAAGYATRLYPLTEHFPKPLLAVGGKPIVDWLIDDLAKLRSSTVLSSLPITGLSSTLKRGGRTRPSHVRRKSRYWTTAPPPMRTVWARVRDMSLVIDALGLADDLLVIAGDNVLDFRLSGFVAFAQEKRASCVMCHEEPELRRQQKTAIITVDERQRITSYEEKPLHPRGNLAVPPFYYYTQRSTARVQEALAAGCNGDAPGSFAAWLSQRTPMYAYRMPGKRYDVGDIASYEHVQRIFAQK